MPTVQDLPPEVLYRIPELVEGTPAAPLAPLASSSLVARAWRHPSQRLLINNIRPHHLHEHIAGKASPVITSRTIRVALVSEGSAQELLDFFAQEDVIIEGLVVHWTRACDLDLSTISIKLLAGLKLLEIKGHLAERLIIPSSISLELRYFSLATRFLPTVSFLGSLFEAAPSLTSLDLQLSHSESLTSDYDAVMQVLAPQLRHLRLAADATTLAISPTAFDFRGFLASCSSLQSLELYSATPSHTKAMLAAICSPLVLLTTDMDDRWARAASEQGIAELVALLQLPVMASLRRWRIPEGRSFKGPTLTAVQRAQWEGGCRARGVEPRDERRLFTAFEQLQSYTPIIQHGRPLPSDALSFPPLNAWTSRAQYTPVQHTASLFFSQTTPPSSWTDTSRGELPRRPLPLCRASPTYSRLVGRSACLFRDD